MNWWNFIKAYLGILVAVITTALMTMNNVVASLINTLGETVALVSLATIALLIIALIAAGIAYE